MAVAGSKTMLHALMATIRSALARASRKHRDREQTRRIRSLVMGARADKLRALAIAERMTASDLDEALDLLTSDYAITRDEAVLLIERHGLSLAIAALESTDADA